MMSGFLPLTFGMLATFGTAVFFYSRTETTPARKLLLHPSAIEKADVPAAALLVKLTRDEVEKSPAIATDEPVSQQMEHRLYGYYGVDPLWNGGYYGRDSRRAATT